MADTRQCPNCGAGISDDSSDGLCRECLLRLGLHEPACLRIRCPHCHNRVELLDDGPIEDIECPSCGSHFSMVSGETATYDISATQTIAHFELLDRVGMGHFGSVWKARDTKLDRIVALKVPRKEQLDAAEVEQFMREARAAAQVSHSNIVSVHEVGREDNAVYIVSDFVEGASLADWMTGQRLTPREAAELCVKITDALHEAHEAGIVHRDLKPGNIMLDMDGEPHLTDFGLAKRQTGEITMTVEGRILGTPAYMSPEQAGGHGHTADRRSDIYSLGVILYQLLTGELPFRGETRMLIVQVLRDEPPSPRRLNSQIPRDLETICLKCLEKEPGKRYQTAAKVNGELCRFLEGAAIEARPIGRIERNWRWCKRNPVVAGLIATAMTLLAAVACVGAAGYISTNAALSLAEDERDRAKESAARERLALADATTNLYAAKVNLAAAAWERSEPFECRKILDSCPADQRHWEWVYLHGMFDAGYITLPGKGGGLLATAFSPDGTLIAAGGRSGRLGIWDRATSRQVATCFGHSDRIVSVAFSPSGEYLASACYDNTARVWDSEDGKEVWFIRMKRARA